MCFGLRPIHLSLRRGKPRICSEVNLLLFDRGLSRVDILRVVPNLVPIELTSLFSQPINAFAANIPTHARIYILYIFIDDFGSEADKLRGSPILPPEYVSK